MSEILRHINDLGLVNYEPVTLRAGEVSEYYVDVKKGFGNPEFLQAAAGAITDQLPDEVTCIAGSGYGGLPLVSAVSLQARLPASFIRDNVKNHGLGGLIDGHTPNADDVVAIVDDVFTTGSSLRETIEVVLGTQAEISSCHVVVKRGVGELPVPLFHLVDVDNLTIQD